MLYVIKTENFEAERETKEEITSLVDDLTTKGIKFEVFERTYNASRSKVMSDNKISLSMSVTVRENEYESGKEHEFSVELMRFSKDAIKKSIEKENLNFKVDYFLVSYDTKNETNQSTSRRTKPYMIYTHHTRKIKYDTLEVLYYGKKSRWF